MTDNHRYCVIMCGGIGSRFWPYSRTDRPKQFIDFFGTGRSLLQMSYDRISPLVPKENIIIVTNSHYAPLVKEQLPELNDDQILLEPARRNTAPCIAWAAYHIAARDPQASMIVTPSDHLITRAISVGDYVLTGGELAAAIISDAVIRLVPGVISDEQSALSDCFQDDILAAPIYTRPADYKGWKVPEILLSGNEAKIRQWEFDQAMERTKRLRPDLLK